MDNKEKKLVNSNDGWNYKPDLPLQNSPLFEFPFNFRNILSWFHINYLSLSIRVFVLFIAVLSWLLFTPNLSECKDFEFNWIMEIYLRNLFLIISIAGSIHLYFYTFIKQETNLKFDKRMMAKNNKIFKFNNQVFDNIYYTIFYGLTIWTLNEVFFIWLFANEYISNSFWNENIIWNILIILIIPIWHSFHFYWIHRFMHIKFIYRKIHLVHHRNINIGPWSGMSFHPVEQIIYLSSVFIHLIILSNPFHIIYHMQYLIFNAVIAHSGFEGLLIKNKNKLNLGRFHHQLHHRFVECNYGNAEMPWDKWFGTFHDGTQGQMKKIKENRIL